MTVKITGQVPTTRYGSSGLYGMDIALARRWLNDKEQFEYTPGIPLRCGYEIYGREEAGKNTLAYYLAGRAKPTGRVLVMGIDAGYDLNYTKSDFSRAGFKGEVHFVPSVDEKTGEVFDHERMLKQMTDEFEDKEDVNAIIFDNVGAIQVISERKTGDKDHSYGQAVLGRRAQMMAQFCRDASRAVISRSDGKPGMVLILNHVLAKIGALVPGQVTTPGGDTIKFFVAVRLYLQREHLAQYKIENTFTTRVKVEKLRFGGRGRMFRFVIIPDVGVSPELTAVLDGIELGVVDRGNTVRVGNANRKTSLGRIGELVEAATRGDRDRFKPVFKALDDYMAKGKYAALMDEKETEAAE